MKFKNETDRFDDYLNSPYKVVNCNAQELSQYLIKTLNDSGIDPEKFNTSGGSLDPDIEIYEYQPFFLLERENGDYTLLDGFRRLLWYNAPSHNIGVRIYKEKDLTDHQIMKLLVYLNHFKFYGGNGNYHDRGFSLAMRTIFDLNIYKYRVVFDSYLSSNETERKYWRENKTQEEHISNVKERMLNPMFISDMKFIESLHDKGIMYNDIFGSLIFKMRNKFPEKEFTSEFLTKINENKIILELQEKFKKSGDNTSATSQKLVNQLVPLYENIFNEIFGLSVEKTYAEKNDEIKNLIKGLKKDKTLSKITGHQKEYLIDMILRYRLTNKIPINFKCVVHPVEHDPYRWRNDESKIKLDYGILPYNVKFIKTERRNMTTDIVFGFFVDDKEFRFRHNYNGYWGYGKKYVEVEQLGTIPTSRYKVDLFVNVTKDEIEYCDENRHEFWKEQDK